MVLRRLGFQLLCAVLLITLPAENRAADLAEAGLGNASGSGDDRLSLLHWNPHWQCFQREPRCKEKAEEALDADLTRLGVDFAGVVELMDDSYEPPAGFSTVVSNCNPSERVTLIYSEARWRTVPNASVQGCMRSHDRAFVVQAFESMDPASLLPRVVIVAAHYPHDRSVPILRGAIEEVVKLSSESRVILLADTNQVVPSTQIARDAGIPHGESVASSSLYDSCCKIHNGFVWKFDRIVANFGVDIRSTLLHDPTPSWAGVSFHKGVHAWLDMPSSPELVVLRRELPKLGDLEALNEATITDDVQSPAYAAAYAADVRTDAKIGADVKAVTSSRKSSFWWASGLGILGVGFMVLGLGLFLLAPSSAPSSRPSPVEARAYTAPLE